MNLYNKIIKKLINKKITISIVESCTGGLLSSKITEVSGVSKIFYLGLILYSYQSKSSIDERFLKLDIINSGNLQNSYLAGLAMGLLVQIQQAAGQDLFIPTIYFLGISMKDKHIPDVMHVDNEEGEPFVRILGLLNSDWKEEWGGGFFHDETSNYIKPTSFAIFDGSRPHMAEEIFTDKKRFAIDFTVKKYEVEDK